MSPELVDYRVVREFSPTMRITLNKMNLPFPMTSRESLMLMSYKIEGDTVTTCGCSVEYAEVPADPKFLRAVSLMMYSVLRPTPDGKTQLSSIGHTDPKGMVPAFFMNAMVKRSAGNMLKLKEAMAAWAKSSS
eukprot:TRINITY_DN1309_c0_g1_i2.p1 TRINITY_DN1309_c0_g1~~TRINITY_DN1309_c0_g1_i2.p1  ORF type:complete len:133 (+),score=18.33 TRINITY_DN1309_c0_g1_i2:641-1039(+)